MSDTAVSENVQSRVTVGEALEDNVHIRADGAESGKRNKLRVADQGEENAGG
jgi:hypothetical protein